MLIGRDLKLSIQTLDSEAIDPKRGFKGGRKGQIFCSGEDFWML